ncbi:tyrosine-type recombinase/integrase [Lacrimispora sp.]|uniref:tyrosine-type recombinase/integrase n=1 Tax=Lacrimispora sp. TaxID=2719234 RepID=UPI0034604FFD
MNNLEQLISEYLEYCHYQKKLNQKTIKAYKIDLNQYYGHIKDAETAFKRNNIINYITDLHKKYKPKSVKRKIASLKAFFSYLEYEDILPENPFSKIKIKFQEPFLLPRTISTASMQKLFQAAYQNMGLKGASEYQEKSAVRDIAVLELLFSTGLRVSELCSLKCSDLDLEQGSIRIYGKGSKERIVLLANVQVLSALTAYQRLFQKNIQAEGFFFCNRLGNRLSEQSVRFMINRYADMSGLTEHITPHMFRHTFATLLLEEDVDIRYIQQILGHSSIMTTQIYTHVTAYKQRNILMTKNPRNKLNC